MKAPDIQVIRESISKIVSMLTSRKIKVTQRGVKAYVGYNARTGAIEVVNVPYLPDNASPEFIAAVQGFLDHEVGHVLFTDQAVVREAAKHGTRISNMANIIEDVFIEKKMTEAFMGSSANLESVRKFFLEKISRPKIMEAVSAGDLDKAMGYAIVPAFRAWGGQTSSQDFIKDPVIAKLVAPMHAKLGDDILKRLPKLKSSKECLQLAIEVKKALEPPPPPPPPPAPPPPPPPAAPPPPSDDQDESDEEQEQQTDPNAEGTPEEQSDDPGAGQPEEEEEQQGDGGPAPSMDEQQDDLSDAVNAAAEDEQPEPEEEEQAPCAPSLPEDTDPQAESGEPEDVGDQGDDAPGGTAGEQEEGEDGEQQGSAGNAPGDDDDDSDREDDAHTGQDSAEGKGDGSQDDGVGPGSSEDDSASAPKDERDYSDLFEEDRDFDKEISEGLTKTAEHQFNSTPYKIYSTDWDKVEVVRQSTSAHNIAELEKGTEGTLGVMQKQLERAIAAQARKSWNPAQRTGRVSPGALFKSAVGDDRLFRKRFETRAKNTAVTLLVDCSGSMVYSGAITIAAKTAFALSSVLERIKVTHEVIGFTTYESNEMTNAMRADATAAVGADDYCRDEAIYMPIFKGFGERLSTEVRGRMATMIGDGGYCRCNIDGESIAIAAHRLRQQRAERHILIVLSDGDPNCSGSYGGVTAMRHHCKKTVEAVEKSGIEVIGVGIQSTAVQSYYKNNVVLSDLKELPTTVMGQITKILLAK